MKTEEAKIDIVDILNDLEGKVSDFDLDEWSEKTLHEIRATDSFKCTVCGAEKFEYDMLKVFKVWENGRIVSHKGICKRCWNFDESSE